MQAFSRSSTPALLQPPPLPSLLLLLPSKLELGGCALLPPLLLPLLLLTSAKQ
jgi:hypothetical protein